MYYLAQNWSSSSGDKPAQIKDFEVIFSRIVSIAIALAGIVLFIMLLIGGFKLLTAGSDPKSAESAKKTITAAIIGILAIALSYLVLVVIESLTGAKVTQFIVSPGN